MCVYVDGCRQNCINISMYVHIYMGVVFWTLKSFVCVVGAYLQITEASNK